MYVERIILQIDAGVSPSEPGHGKTVVWSTGMMFDFGSNERGSIPLTTNQNKIGPVA